MPREDEPGEAIRVREARIAYLELENANLTREVERLRVVEKRYGILLRWLQGTHQRLGTLLGLIDVVEGTRA